METKPWLEQVEESHRTHESLSDIENVNDLTKRFISVGDELRGVKGDLENSVKLLGENPTDEERTAFYMKMGRPEKAEGYELKRLELPEGLPYDEALEQKFREFAFTSGMSADTAQKLYGLYSEHVLGSYNSQIDASKATIKQEQDGAMKVLTEKWGDKTKENIELAVRAQEKIGGEPLKKVLEEYGLGDHPVVVELFHTIAASIADDKMGLGIPAGTKGSDGHPLSKVYPEMDEAHGGKRQ